MRQAFTSFTSAIACSTFAAFGPIPDASAADLLSFQAVPIKGPECVGDTTEYFYAEDELAPDPATSVPALAHFYLVVRNLGLNAVAASPTYDFGRLPLDYEEPLLRGSALTGLTVPEPKTRWQRSSRADSTADDSSAFQIQCYDAGSFINSWTFPFATIPGSGAHSAYGYDFHELELPRVFDDDPATDFVLQTSLEVPWVALWPSPTTGEAPVGQVSLFAYFRDLITGKVFASLLLLFDNRLGVNGNFESYVADDLRTPFVSMTLNSHAGYATLSPSSGIATGVPWTGLRFFRGHISQENFRNMVRDVNAYCAAHRDAPFCDAAPGSLDAFSGDVRNYELTSFGVLHEIARAPDSNISMGVHVFGLGAWNFH